jgi:hypothetical protein
MNYNKKYLKYKLVQSKKIKQYGSALQGDRFTIYKSKEAIGGHKYRWHNDNKHFLNFSGDLWLQNTGNDDFPKKYEIWSAKIVSSTPINSNDSETTVQLLERQDTTDMNLLKKDHGEGFKYTVIYIGHEKLSTTILFQEKHHL